MSGDRYYINDHLGNTRIAFKDNNGDGSINIGDNENEILQETNYYPFGMSFAEQNINYSNKNLYNGKELQDNFDLNWYDYGARFKDGTRWTTIDPLAELYYSTSPYAYVRNSPINRYDPNGMWDDEFGNRHRPPEKDKWRKEWRKLHGLGDENNDKPSPGHYELTEAEIDDLFSSDLFDGVGGPGDNRNDYPTIDKGGYLPSLHATVTFLYYTAAKAGVEVGALIYKDENENVKYWVAPWENNLQYKCKYSAIKNIPGYKNFEYLASIHSHTSLPKTTWEGPSWMDVEYSKNSQLPTFVLGHNNVYRVLPNEMYSHYPIQLDPFQTVPAIKPIGTTYDWLTKGVIINF